jgi:hypothetical protein
MPRATVSHKGIRHELKTLEGGFVELRQLSYEEILARRDGVTNMSLEREMIEDEANLSMQINMMQLWAREYDFRNCIRNHNLEDDNGELLDFTKKGTLGMLDPKVGREIEALIDALNGDNDDSVAMKGFTNAAGSSSTEENDGSSTLNEHLVETQ